MGNKLILLKTAKAILRGIYSPMKLRKNRDKITILSRQSDDPSADIALLVDYMSKEHPETEIKVMCRNLESSSAAGYGIHMISQMWNMANSRLILLDGYNIAPSILEHKDGTCIVQMWHALAAIKKFGYQSLGRAGGHSRSIAEIMCMHRNYTHVLAPSKETGKLFCEAFDTDPKHLVMLGLPRIDLLTSQGDDGRDLREEYRIPPEKEVVLYAPTLRKSGKLSIDDLIDNVDKDRYALVICPHPLDMITGKDQERSPEEIIVDRKNDAYRWLDACDLAITDYSAFSVEASLKDKPLYFYVPDIEEYMEDEGLNFDPRSQMPEVTAEKGKDLAEMIKGDYPCDVLTGFRDRFIEIETDNCTKRLGDYINGLVKKAD